MNIYQVIYISKASNSFSAAQLREILISSRQRNQSLGVTGLLLYSHGNFMQVLEGPESAVAEVIASIQKDDRHRNIDFLRVDQRESRSFPDWQMGFRNFTVKAEELTSISRFLEPDFDTSLYRDELNQAHQMLLTFRHAHLT